MTRARQPTHRTCWAAAIVMFVAVTGCRTERRVERADSGAAASTPATPPPPATDARGWKAAVAGPVLVVPASDSGVAVVVLPGLSDGEVGDTTMISAVIPPRPITLDLFARGARIGSATIDRATLAATTDTACSAWPVARLSGVAHGWTAALDAGRARSVPLDSLASFSRADSLALTIDVTRLASAQPGSTAAFRGLPFVVRALYRFTPVAGRRAIAASIVRHLNVEASPREEDLFLVAERDSAGGPWTVEYIARSSGREADAETTDVLALLEIGGVPTMVISRETDDGIAYALLGRDASGVWRVTWESAYTGC